MRNRRPVAFRGRWLVLAASTFVTLAAAPVLAADYWVSTTGNDSAPGTSAAPWRTLQHAAAQVAPGDVVHVLPGTYAGFQVTTSGTPSARIVFRADGDVLLNAPNPSTPDIVNLEGASYVTVEGFRVEDAPRIGIRAVQATGVVIRGNTVARSGLTGILTGWTPGVRIENNVCSTSIQEHGIYVSNSDTPADDPVIRGNEVFGNAKNGIQVNGDCWEGGDGVIEGAVIDANLVHDNTWKGLSLISMQGSVVQNNVVWNNGLSAGAGGIHLADQVGPSCGLPSSQNVVVNNTVVEPRIACIRMTDGSTGNVVFNNVCVASSVGNAIVDEVGGNLVDASSNVVRASTAGLFVDATAADFHPAAGGPLVDAGVASYQGQSAPVIDAAGQPRPAGGWDAGAYEDGSAGAPDTTPPTVAITSPADGTSLTAPVTLAAAASDDRGVTGVQFRLDGAPFGVELTSPPWAVVLDPSGLGGGTHTVQAEARDAAGNRATSATVAFDVPLSTGGIPATHPRLWLHTARLAKLRQRACFDDAGNPIPGCTRTAFADIFLNFIATSTKADAWHYALAWQVTGDAQYATKAIEMVDQQVACDYTCIANANNKFLYVRDFMRNACLVYDWCYDRLTPQQRATWIDYMNRMIFITWNDNAEANAIFDTGDWATSNPKQNYFYNYLLATTYVALATWGENPGTFTANGQTHTLYLLMDSRDNASPRYTDIFEFLMAKLTQQALPTLDTRGKGGGWLEGENYGRAMKRHLFEAFTLLAETAGIDYFHDPAHPFAREAVRYQLMTVQPGGKILYPGGDASQEPTLRTNPYDRHMMLLLAGGLAGTVESQYAQYWCNHVLTQMQGISDMIPVDFFLHDPDLPERDFSELPTRYFSEGMDWVHSRSDWSDNAIAVTFTSTDRVQGHQHRDQNHFVIYIGGSADPVDGWILTDTQPYSSTLPRSSDWHNTILVGGTSQRFGAGTGDMIRYEAAPTYTYAVGDASDAYYTNPGNYGSGDQKMVDVFQRELVHILPGYVVAYDRVTLAPGFEQQPVEVLFHYPRVRPAMTGNVVTVTNDQGRLFHTVLLPASPSITWQDENALAGADRMETWRMVIRDAVTSPSYRFLNVWQATRPTTATPVAVERVESQDGQMVGAVIRDPSEEQVVMFSKDPRGAPPAGDIIYQVGLRRGARQHLFDLVPGLGYAIEVARAGDPDEPAEATAPTGGRTAWRVRVRRGGPHVASAAGSLVFTLDEILARPRPLALR